LPAVAVTVTGSPGKIEAGLAAHDSVTGGGVVNEPKLKTAPALTRAALMLVGPVTLEPKFILMYSESIWKKRIEK
jgi:hypothetical protein